MRTLVATLALCGTLAAPARAQETAAPASPARPRLVVLVVIDQCRSDYLQRFARVMPADGIARLLATGSSWPQAAHPHTVTSTGPGHAAIATGCRPARAGIPENQWLDRDGNTVYCVADAQCHVTGSVAGLPKSGVSAAMLERPTLGDVMQDELGDDSLVLSFSWKDRAALLLDGRHGDGAYWIDGRSGTWVGTSTLGATLPDWLAALNDPAPVRSHAGITWKELSSAEDALALAGLDDVLGEKDIAGFGTSFPHVIPPAPAAPAPCGAVSTFEHVSPVGDVVVMETVRAALEHTALGRDDVPDLLCVGFSSLDGAGHAFGPDSREVMDVFLAMDRRLAELMALLDASVGAGRWTLALSSDHGVTPMSERSGIARLDLGALAQAVEAGLRDRYGAPPPRPDEADGKGRPRWILGLIKPSLWLDVPRLTAAGIDPQEAGETAAAALASFPGVLLAASRARLAAALAEPDGVDADLLALARDVHPTRSGDVLFLLQPGVTPVTPEAADHGSQSADDRRVPVILAGAGIAAGVHAEAAAPMDIAPTLAALLGLHGMQDADGRVLAEALAGGP